MANLTLDETFIRRARRLLCRGAVEVSSVPGRIGSMAADILIVAERAVKAARLHAIRQGCVDRKSPAVQVTERADRGIALVGGRMHSRCPGRHRAGRPGSGMGRAPAMAGGRGTRFLRDPAREIFSVALLAARKTGFGTRLLCPCAMCIRILPVGYNMLAGVGIKRGLLVCLAASSKHRDEDEPEDEKAGFFQSGYL